MSSFVGRAFTYVDAVKRMHLVRIDRASPSDPASSPECIATIVESMDARAVGAVVHLLYSDLRPRLVFDIARKEAEIGTAALRQATEIVRDARFRAGRKEAKEPDTWR